MSVPDFPPPAERTRRPHDWQSHRPPWWPENEEWPPRRRHWRPGRNPFLRRLGCFIAVFNLFGFLLFAAIIGIVLNALGVLHFSLDRFQWVLPLAGIFFVLVLATLFRAVRSLRRMTIPLDGLLNASNQVAEGDYSARVDEKGPPEVRSLTRAFNTMAARLELHDQQRRALLADVSHELRTPLTIIQGNIEGVLDGVYPADKARLASILEETQILSRLIEDLRTSSLAESGALQMKRESTDLTALIRETVAAFQSQADAAGVRIETALGPDELILEIDPERIRQVLANLLSNAIRYSPRGGAIQAGLADSGTPPAGTPGAGRRVEVWVQDMGPGIAAADLPHVFDRFYKSGDSRGMGLGLSIAKYIVEAHGGVIRAESGPGRGTRISFALPD